MPVTAVFLFGSHARGDQDARSDTDLLMVTTEDAPRHSVTGHLSTSFYQLLDLRRRARDGDLFVCHIVREGKALYDPEAQLEELRSKFRLRQSYDAEIQQATDLGWFLFHYGAAVANSSLVNRRIAWCVRTILISRSAEIGSPVFSTSGLAEFAKSNSVFRLIKHKDDKAIDDSLLPALKQLLTRFGGRRMVAHDAGYGGFVRRFNETSNQVALGLLKADAASAVAYTSGKGN
ncbi:putative nucleotidyltransferase (plasmid) [Ensifer sp. WSM1721]|uniref:anti-phage Hailong system nucleotidyltransferase HalB n=1 Tax=Ensifer sp. WSM1721 TaxID=1041159 RepID=UPI00047874C4|nr:nucleotidyltransferase domain-containing protein [Ensifer sp. WSM1721]